MNNLEVCAADTSTAFLHGKTREKVHIKAGKEFGEHAGKTLIVDKGIHGLRTSAAGFHEALSAELRKMGFRPSEADFDLWIRPMGDHCEHLATHVDDILVFSKNPMPIIREIRETFVLKGVGKPECCLGGNFHTVADKDVDNAQEAGNDDPQHHLSKKWLKEDVTMAFSARTHIEQSLGELEKMMGTSGLALQNSPVLGRPMNPK